MKSCSTKSVPGEGLPGNESVHNFQREENVPRLGRVLLSIASGLVFAILILSLVLLPVCFAYITTGDTIQMALAREASNAEGTQPLMCVQVNVPFAEGAPEEVVNGMETAGFGPAGVEVLPHAARSRIRTRSFNNLADLSAALVLIREKFPHAKAVDRSEIAAWSAEVICMRTHEVPGSARRSALTEEQAEDILEEIRCRMAAAYQSHEAGEPPFDWKTQTQWERHSMRLCVFGTLLQVVHFRSEYEELLYEHLHPDSCYRDCGERIDCTLGLGSNHS